MSGCPSRVTSLASPSSTASSVPMFHYPCVTPHVSPWVPLCQTKTCLGDPAESPPWHDRVPLIQVSPWVDGQLNLLLSRTIQQYFNNIITGESAWLAEDPDLFCFGRFLFRVFGVFFFVNSVKILEGGDGQDQLTNNMIYLMLFSSLHLTFRVYHSSSEVSRLVTRYGCEEFARTLQELLLNNFIRIL